MTSMLAHGGTAGLAAEILLLSLPVLALVMLWWWNRRLGRREAQGGDRGGDWSGDRAGGPGQPDEPADPSGGGPVVP